MRVQIKKRSSTKAERIFSEILKKNHIPFRYRQIVGGREIDFVILNYAIEIDGHEQLSSKNDWLIKKGYIPVHYTNKVLLNDRSAVEEDILNKYGIRTQNNKFCFER